MYWGDWMGLMGSLLWAGCATAQVYLVGYLRGRDSRERLAAAAGAAGARATATVMGEEAAPGEKEGRDRLATEGARRGGGASRNGMPGAA